MRLNDADATPVRRMSGLRWLAIAAVLWAAFELLRSGAADFLRLEPCAYLDSVQNAGKRPDPALLGRARERLELARSLDPGNPVVHEYLALVDVHRARLVAGDAALRGGYLESAETHYAAALALRPNSAYLWAGVAAVRSALLHDAGVQASRGSAITAGEARGYEAAASRAMILGPWEPGVLRTLALSASPHYAELSTNGRALIDEAQRRLKRLDAQDL